MQQPASPEDTALYSDECSEVFRLRPETQSTDDRVRYIGSKARVAEAILDIVGPPQRKSGRFVDCFAGSGAVSRVAVLRGWSVQASDHLISSVIFTKARLTVDKSVPFHKLGGYRNAINRLNTARPVEGPIFKEYTPSGRSRSGHWRRYFTQENGCRIDGVRRCIASWAEQSLITQDEADLLIADLLTACNQVANIAGTYGCFLRDWTPSALCPLRLMPRLLLAGSVYTHVSNMDAFLVPDRPEDVLYIDPPYTKRQYAAYYHLLETIAIGDHPIVDGITGLRPWQEKSSPFCFKRRALNAFVQLLSGKQARKVFISYSSEGHVELSRLEAQLSSLGRVKVYPLTEITRYTPNIKARLNGEEVQEYLIQVIRD